jgi:hypothetical protein
MATAGLRVRRRSPVLYVALGLSLMGGVAASPLLGNTVEPAAAFCSMDPPIRFSAARTRRIVREATVVVRATAIGYTPVPEGSTRPDLRYVAFAVREVLKGAAGDTLRIYGGLDDRDSFQEGPVPYLSYHRRHAGDCAAYTYRPGTEYLLLMAPSTAGLGISPYWEVLAPTNEQIRGKDDPWVVWVRREIAASSAR